MSEKDQAKERERGLGPWRPFGDLAGWEGIFPRRASRLMQELFGDWPAAPHAGAFVPAVDVSENDACYTITIEIPGARKDDVHVALQEGVLLVHGEKKSEREEKKDRSRYVERSYGSFSRAFSLPADADAEHLEASFKDGVLGIRIPRSEAAKPRQIAIKS
jgi:HSP20 family protein